MPGGEGVTGRASLSAAPGWATGTQPEVREQVSVCNYLCAFGVPGLCRCFIASATVPSVFRSL